MPRMMGSIRDARRHQVVLVLSSAFMAILLFTMLSSGDSFQQRKQTAWNHDAQPQRQQMGSDSVGPATVTVTQKEIFTLTERPAPTNTAMANPLALTRNECVEKFPGLFSEIQRAVKMRKGKLIEHRDLDNDKLRGVQGYTKVLVHDGKMYILEATPEPGFSRRLAILHALHNAISTSSEKIPDAEFLVNIWDSVDVDALTWSLTRKASKKGAQNNWLMPDFGLWSWPEPKVGSYDEVLMKSDAVDNEYQTSSGERSLQGKSDMAVWRGALLGLGLRQSLVKVTQGKPWADVQELNWGDKEELKKRMLSMADHCRYKYLLHVEGYSYSGRLKYLQACHSVVIAHELEWVQHYFPMMIDAGPEQNYVKVKRDWSDLEEKIQWLQDHPKEANDIAQRGRAVMRAYQSQAANNCYWRELIRAWSELQNFKPALTKTDDDGNEQWRGVPWESFAIMQKVDWDPA